MPHVARFAGLIVPILLIVSDSCGVYAEELGAKTGVGCWFWSDQEFRPEGYRSFLDLYARHTAFGLLTTSIRYPAEVTDSAVHDQIAAATSYATERGIGIALDLDVRLARAAFQARYPDEMQEIVRLREFPLRTEGEVAARVESLSLGDHYTFRARPYDSIAGRVVRVYSYVRDDRGIDSESVRDITSASRIVEESKDAVAIEILCEAGDAGRTACVVAAFTLFAADVFAPHLIEFERDVMRQYADVPLAGVCKDEWGFPGRFDPTPDDLWFSTAMADAYAARRPGRDLVDDLLLMAKGFRGKEIDRNAAINAWMEMLRERNVNVENAFYDNVKAVFGQAAYVGTHPTWFPFPGKQEAFKNGLDWWSVKRDIAQTDETTPFSARTALAKKWGSGVWLNMYYAPTLSDYDQDIWRHALGGGRMNFHPVWPREMNDLADSLLTSQALLADARVRLIDFISSAPMDCPVAVVFGHPAYLNWSDDGFADAGVSIADVLWERGIYADLIPSSEILSGALARDSDGYLAYGGQRYEAAVFYHLEFERPEIAAFMIATASAGPTTCFRVGDWSTSFDGMPFDDSYLGESLSAREDDNVIAAIEALLAAREIPRQPAAERRSLHGFPDSMVPPRAGTCRLVDGTRITLRGERVASGDPIMERIVVEGISIDVDALGVVAVRVSDAGHVDAFACGGLRRFSGGSLSIELGERCDIGLRRTSAGAWEGAILGDEEIPPALKAICSDWQRYAMPRPRP